MKVNGTKAGAGEPNNSVMHGSPAAGAEDATKSANVGIVAQLLLVPPAEQVQQPATAENSSHSCASSTSENGHAAAGPAHKPDLDYLGQLLKDKKQLSAFPNVFAHVERLIDDEINRVRIAIFQCEFSREPLQLPEPVGEVVTQQEKVFVPVKQFPDYNFVGRILGPRGMTAKQLEAETGCKIMVRGRGSMRDRKKEDLNRGKPNWEHLNEELHVIIQCEDTPNRIPMKIARAVEEVNKLLVPQPEGEDELKRKQLMELAIINGTFRNGTSASGGAMAAAQAKGGNQQLQFDQRTLSLLGSSAAGLAGAPLILSSQLAKGQPTNQMPLSTAQQQSSAAATSLATQALLQQLAGIQQNGGGILGTPGPYGLPLAQSLGAGNSLDLLALSGQMHSQQQQQQFDPSAAAMAAHQQQQQLVALFQQQQMALIQQQQQQQANGIAFGEYAAAAAAAAATANGNGNGGDSTGAMLSSSQRRYIGHSRELAHPYSSQQQPGNQN